MFQVYDNRCGQGEIGEIGAEPGQDLCFGITTLAPLEEVCLQVGVVPIRRMQLPTTVWCSSTIAEQGDELVSPKHFCNRPTVTLKYGSFTCDVSLNLVIEVQGGANTAESSSLASPLLLNQAPRAHHARDGRSLRELSTSPVLSQTVRLSLHFLNRRSTETVSHVLEAEPVSLPRVREGAWSCGEVLESSGEVLMEGQGGGAGRLEGGGRHAAQGEAQCPRDRQQQHLERKVLGQISLLEFLPKYKLLD